MDDQQVAQWKADARKAAEEDIKEWGPGRRARVFTDGLGALGVGTSLTDRNSEGNVKQREYDRVMFGEEIDPAWEEDHPEPWADAEPGE